MNGRLQYNEQKVQAISVTVGTPRAFPASASLFSRPTLDGMRKWKVRSGSSAFALSTTRTQT